jgi:DNA-3-methyladenine glycosylase II
MASLKQADRFLASQDPDFAALIAKVGPSRLAIERKREPYQALMRAVTYQQLHGRAAEAIMGRVIGLFPDHPFPPPDQFLACTDQELRACGLSANKLLAMRDIAAKTVSGLVPSRAAAARLDNEALIERLTALRGVGRWTVEMFLMFSLGRPDILPIDDFGVREGYRKLKKLEVQPKPKALAEIGLAWAPYRSTAAWYLWRAADNKPSEVNS